MQTPFLFEVVQNNSWCVRQVIRIPADESYTCICKTGLSGPTIYSIALGMDGCVLRSREVGSA